ncbi:MAG: hypothetical protein WCO92_00040 [Verrucomicrobiota bacterium]
MKSFSSKNQRAIVAIVTNDYFHQAMVLGRSIKCFEPESDFIVFVVGYDEEDLDYQNADFTVLDAKILNPKEWRRFVFQYDGLQASCALKPLAMLHLLTEYEKVIYLDADMKLFGPLEQGWKELGGADLSLTPHSYLPIKDDGFAPARVTMRLAGIFNAGYIGVSESGSSFLKWWWEQTNYNCVAAHCRGVFLDQIYLNEASYMVQRLAILKDHSYNVACWNLHERGLKKTCSKKFPYLVNEKPLICFHFSSYADLIKVRPPPCGKEIFYDLYRKYNKETLLEKRKLLSSEKQYPFNYFSDGAMISVSWREYMRRGIPELENVKDPFLLNDFTREMIEAVMVRRPGTYQPKPERENFFMLPSLVPSEEAS